LQRVTNSVVTSTPPPPPPPHHRAAGTPEAWLADPPPPPAEKCGLQPEGRAAPGAAPDRCVPNVGPAAVGPPRHLPVRLSARHFKSRVITTLKPNDLLRSAPHRMQRRNRMAGNHYHPPRSAQQASLNHPALDAGQPQSIPLRQTDGAADADAVRTIAAIADSMFGPRYPPPFHHGLHPPYPEPSQPKRRRSSPPHW